MATSSCEEATQATLKQNDYVLWHDLRYTRITASKAYEAANCTVLNIILTESIMGASKLKDTVEVEQQRKVKIKKCFIKLNPNYPTMGASPDDESDVYSIEIKCPSSEKAISRYIGLGNSVFLTTYMAQVGGAALGVFEQEPLTLKIIEHPAVIATPHLDASTENVQARVGRAIAEQLVNPVKPGQPL